MNTEDFSTDYMKKIAEKLQKVLNSSDYSLSTSLPSKSHQDSDSPQIPKFLNPTTKTSATLTPFSEVYKRMQAYQTRHNQILQKNIEKSEEKLKKTCTHTPKLNENSKKIIRDISPIHVRYKEILSKKERKITQQIIKIKNEQEEKLKKELTFKPKITESNNSLRTNEEYYNYMKS